MFDLSKLIVTLSVSRELSLEFGRISLKSTRIDLIEHVCMALVLFEIKRLNPTPYKSTSNDDYE